MKSVITSIYKTEQDVIEGIHDYDLAITQHKIDMAEHHGDLAWEEGLANLLATKRLLEERLLEVSQ